MLTKSQEKLIRSLKTKKARQKHGLCLVEGQKVVALAKDFIEYTFSHKDSSHFEKLVTTETPQFLAAVARIPRWGIENVVSRDIIVLLDGVQDPGNVGAILRLCLGFEASLVLVESVDVTSPKVIRSSVGAIFQTPWIQASRKDVDDIIKKIDHPVYRLEKRKNSVKFDKADIKTPLILVAGSEGKGIRKDIKGESVYIKHDKALESLNVGHALAIALYQIRI